MRIVIPSSGRADKIYSTRYIPPHIPYNIVVTKQDYPSYRHLPNVLVAPGVSGISDKRHWCCMNIDDPHLVFLDDDIGIFERYEKGTTRLRKIEDPTILWNHLDFLLTIGYPLAGISHRMGNNSATKNYRINTRAYAVWALDTNVYRQEHLNMGKFEVMEDFYLILSLLTRGYDTITLFSYAHDQRLLGKTPGGCSTWRTKELQERNASKLHAMFPRYVTLMEKQNTYSGQFNGESYIDVRVLWNRAGKEAKL